MQAPSLSLSKGTKGKVKSSKRGHGSSSKRLTGGAGGIGRQKRRKTNATNALIKIAEITPWSMDGKSSSHSVDQDDD